MELKDYREQLDQIDDQLTALFKRRMETVRQVADYKKNAGVVPAVDHQLGAAACLQVHGVLLPGDGGSAAWRTAWRRPCSASRRCGACPLARA